MQHAVRIVILVLTAIFFIHVLLTSGHAEEKKVVWKGELEDGTTITADDLSKILEERRRWFETDFEQGRYWELNRAKLSGADLVGAHFSEMDLLGADLSGADLSWADLSGTNLSLATLRGADLVYADLRGADLSGADLSGAELRWANLSGAELTGANLSGADLRVVDLNNASATFANFGYSRFEPKNTDGLVFLGAKGLSSIRFNKFKAVVDLRKVAKESGLRNEERALTAALRKYRLRAARFHERIFEYVLLGFPTDFGANPWRSLWVLALSIITFSAYYMITLRKHGIDGIWKVWIPERVRKDLGKEKPLRLTLSGLAAFRTGLYFSVLSAFSIGWRELNIANWIARIQRREYILRATGWTRTVSGVQSVISVYLLALWLLTYFGRPFE